MTTLDLVLFAFALGIGGFPGGYKPGFWWTLILAVVAAVPLALIMSLISTLRASAYLRAHQVPWQVQRVVLRPGFWPRFGGTITTILVTAAVVSLFR